MRKTRGPNLPRPLISRGIFRFAAETSLDLSESLAGLRDTLPLGDQGTRSIERHPSFVRVADNPGVGRLRSTLRR